MTLDRKTFWYAVQVRAGREFLVREELAEALEAEAEVYCPSYVETVKPSRHAQRTDEREVPLFRKFLFVRWGETAEWGKVIALRDVQGFIRVGEGALPILDEVIVAIREECELGLHDEVGDAQGVSVKRGDRVKIAGDSNHFLFGRQGVYQGIGRQGKAEIEVSLFGRSTQVEIPLALLSKII